MFQHSSNSAKRSSIWLAAVVGSLVTAQGFFGLASRPLTSAQVSEPRSIQVETTDELSTERSTAAFALSAIGLGIVGFSWARSTKSDNSQSNSTKLDRHLLLLLHQDRAAAERLIAQVQYKHPGRSREWCIEKVKYDLARDRH